MSTAKGSAPGAGSDTILGDIIREAVEMLTKNGMQGAGVASAIVAKLRSRFPVGSELALKFAGISAGKMVADFVASSGIVPPTMKVFVVPIIDDVIKGIASGVAESAATPQATPQEQKPVTAESPKGEMLVVVCDIPGLHEYVGGHILCPTVRVAKRKWEEKNRPRQDQEKTQEKGKDGKQKQHVKNVEKPGLPYPMEVVPYILAKRMTADPFCPVCKVSERMEEELLKAEGEKEKKKPKSRAEWTSEIGRAGRWLAIVLPGSTSMKQSDFINEATQVPPGLWKDLARTIATRMINRARKVAGTMIIRLGDPLPEEFYNNADATTLHLEDIEYCIRFLSGFGVTKLELPTKAEMALDRVASHIPAETVKKGVKVALIGCVVLALIGFVALIGILVAISP